MRITQLSNAGVSVEEAGRVVLVDALNNGSVPLYRATPQPVIDSLPAADLMLYTHAHPDHFDAYMTAAYLKKHPSTPVVAGDAVLERLRYAGVDPKRLTTFKEYHGDIPLRAVPTRHIGPEYRLTPHHSLLVELGGYKVLFTGDASPMAGNFAALSGEHFDVMVATYMYLLYDSANRLFDGTLSTDFLFATHLPIPEQDPERVQERLAALTTSRKYQYFIAYEPLTRYEYNR